MPDYQSIYNDVVISDQRYGLAQNSPGFRAVVQAEPTLVHLAGRSLDLGCGIGFAFEYLSGHQFNFHTFGVDISDEAIRLAKARLSDFQHLDARLKTLESQTIPFEDDYFSLVTSFDVLEHLDEADIDATLKEIGRVLRPGGTFYGAVSCRKSGIDDKFGDNLHRTVKSVDWWINKTAPDHATWDGVRQQFLIWKRASTDGAPMFQ
jgi:SAM-dependent methyltransferase